MINSIQNNENLISVVIDKPKPRNYDKICISFENTVEAIENLSASAFMLYMCFSLATGKNSYPLLDTVYNKMNASDHIVFADIMNELFAHHYLTINERGSDTWYFHDSPLVPSFLSQTGTADCDDDEW